MSDRTAVDRPLSPEDLTKAFSFATDWLGVFIDEVNSLNVYPVPDGDTGTNMHLTMQSVRRQLQEEKPASMSVFSHALSYGSLLGARGNSGVILSQILKGFADEIKNHELLGGPEVASALTSATTSAYDAVLKPAEGTITPRALSRPTPRRPKRRWQRGFRPAAPGAGGPCGDGGRGRYRVSR